MKFAIVVLCSITFIQCDFSKKYRFCVMHLTILCLIKNLNHMRLLGSFIMSLRYIVFFFFYFMLTFLVTNLECIYIITFFLMTSYFRHIACHSKSIFEKFEPKLLEFFRLITFFCLIIQHINFCIIFSY